MLGQCFCQRFRANRLYKIKITSKYKLGSVIACGHRRISGSRFSPRAPREKCRLPTRAAQRFPVRKTFCFGVDQSDQQPRSQERTLGTRLLDQKIACSRLRDSRGSAELRKRKHENKTARQLFAYLFLSRLPHFLRAWNKLIKRQNTARETPRDLARRRV